MEIYAPPHHPYQTFTQGFWYAVIAACVYFVCAFILVVNMLGYFLGHYPDTFALTDAQQTLILQTMLFFVWLAGGAGVFTHVEAHAPSPWHFADAVSLPRMPPALTTCQLYFCDVTILTVGFGDLYPTNSVGRGLVFPYSVGGIIILGLVISSIYKFVHQLGEENVVRHHAERIRLRTVGRTVTSSFEVQRREVEANPKHSHRRGAVASTFKISAPFDGHPARRAVVRQAVHKVAGLPSRVAPRVHKPRLLVLREEKDRFDAMRHIQRQTALFRKWYALIASLVAFGVLWGVGAVVFWQAEKDAQGMTYFNALYFCYVSLLTIGYGDMSPKSNVGRCFFVVWSLIAVPTMTILVSDMGDTVVARFKNVSSSFADFTVLPKERTWRAFLDKHPYVLRWLQVWQARRAARKRLDHGFDTIDPEEVAGTDAAADKANSNCNEAEHQALTRSSGEDEHDADSTLKHRPPSIAALAQQAERDAQGHVPLPAMLAAQLARSVHRVAADLKTAPNTKYSYEEWVHFTRLMCFTRAGAAQKARSKSPAPPAGSAAADTSADTGDGDRTRRDPGPGSRPPADAQAEKAPETERDDGAGGPDAAAEGMLGEWDWIGENSPLTSGLAEAEWLLGELCESLFRVARGMEKLLLSSEGRHFHDNGEGPSQAKLVDRTEEDGDARDADKARSGCDNR